MATILIVDDQPANREYLATLLGYGGHRLLEAADGAEALAIARAERPDLVIADILMPTMDGYEFVHQLRADSSIAHTRVIFYTAHYREEQAQTLARACGVSVVLTKPAEPEIILRTVEDALGLAPPVAPPPETDTFDREHTRLLTDKLSQKANELRRTNERLSALVQLGLQFGSELDLRKLLQSFVHGARDIIGARHAIVGIHDGDGVRFRYLLTSGMDAETAARLGTPDHRSEPLQTVVSKGACLRLRNPTGDPGAIGFSSAYPPIRAWLGAPVASPTRIYGWLALIDKVGGEEFSDEDEQLAGILAAQLGRIYQNGSLYADVLRHAAELEREVAARREVELQLRLQGTALDAAANGIAISDTNGNAVWTNPAFTRMTGYELEEIRGQNLRILKSNKHDSAFYDDLWQTILAGKVWHGEMTNLRKDGSLYVEEQTITPVRDERGQLTHFIAIKQDVTERKKAEEMLHQRSMIHALTADIGLALTRSTTLREMLHGCAESMVRNLGAAFARIWTLNAEQNLLELHASAGLYTHLDGAHSRVPVGQFKIGLIAQERQPHLTNDVLNDPRVGDPAWAKREGMAAFAGYPLLVEDRLVGVVALFARQELPALTLQALEAVANQIALGIERKHAEKALHEAQQRVQHVVASSPAILFTLGVEENQVRGIVWISDNVQDMLGYSVQETYGADWWMGNVHPEDREAVLAQVQREIFTTGHDAHEYRFKHRDGKYRWVRSEMRLLRDAAGKPMEIVGSWSDITERKALEDQFRQAQKMEAIGRLAGGVAHDFNNLLTVINGYGELVISTLPAGDSNRELIREIVAAGDRAAGLTRQLLAFSRKAIIEPKILDLRMVVNNVDRMLRRIIGEDIQLGIVADPEVGAVKADPGQIEQVILNLVVNARDAMPQGGRITIEVRNVELDATYQQTHPDVEPGSHVLLAVSDTGSGMDQATVARVFEPFFSTKGEHGTGLGLATVHGIVKQSGGHVGVYSEVGHGTSFKVYLPRVTQQKSKGKSRFGTGEVPRGTETILLVEDEDSVRVLSRHILQGAGYTLLEARDGAEAVRLADQYSGKIDLLITDVVMPRMGGREVHQRVAAKHPQVRVLFVSGYTDDAVVRHGILEAEVAFLQKPFSPASLASKVRDVLDSKS